MKHIPTFESFIAEGEKKGLWANIHAKRARGEKPAKPGDEDYPDEEAWKAAKKASESEDTNEAYKPIPPTMKISGKFVVKVGTEQNLTMLIAGFERNDDTTDSLYFMDTDDDKRVKWGSFVVKNSDMPNISKGKDVWGKTSKGNLPVKLIRIGDL